MRWCVVGDTMPIFTLGTHQMWSWGNRRNAAQESQPNAPAESTREHQTHKSNASDHSKICPDPTRTKPQTQESSFLSRVSTRKRAQGENQQYAQGTRFWISQSIASSCSERRRSSMSLKAIPNPKKIKKHQNNSLYFLRENQRKMRAPLLWPLRGRRRSRVAAPPADALRGVIKKFTMQPVVMVIYAWIVW